MADDTSISVSRTIDHPAKEVFLLLSNPERHASIDGSGMLRSDDHTDRITANGQKFRMNMYAEAMGGDYQTDNVVTGFVPDKLIAWQTAPAGQQPPGWEWEWDLEPEGPNATKVTLTYNWSKVTDKEILKQVTFPMIKQDQLEGSLSRLAEAVSGS